MSADDLWHSAYSAGVCGWEWVRLVDAWRDTLGRFLTATERRELAGGFLAGQYDRTTYHADRAAMSAAFDRMADAAEREEAIPF